MRVAHLLRKYNPQEWGGTETAVKRLMDGLAVGGISSLVYAPKLSCPFERDPFQEAGHNVLRYRAFVPVSRISKVQRQQLISVGGNIMSLDLIWKLWREPNLSLIHSHTLNRIGGIALTVAQARKLPLVITIHGGVLDLPDSVKANLARPLEGGVEWGKIFGVLLRSRQVMEKADAVITCNRKEAELLLEKHPKKRVLVQPHGVPARIYHQDYSEQARQAFPQLAGKQVLLSVGRIDPVKNQLWLVEQLPSILSRHPDVCLVLVGACTDESYGKLLKKEVRKLGLEDHVHVTGGLPPQDPRLIGLMQNASVVLLPSLSETFGLIILEAWASGAPVISSRTSGACEIVREGENGWLFDLDNPATFHAAVDDVLGKADVAERFARAGWSLVSREYDTDILACRIKQLYEQLIEQKKAS